MHNHVAHHSNEEDILEMRGVCFHIGAKKLLDNISFHVRTHEIYGIFGANGSGKTTLFSVLCGLILPERGGALLLNHQDITHQTLAQRAHLGFAYVPQESSVFTNYRVEENLFIAHEVFFGSSASSCGVEIDGLLEQFSLTHVRHTKAGLLSGGERRRLEIARAMLLKPKFLLLDEPFAGVDPKGVHVIKNHLRQLSNVGILITDHRTRDIIDIAHQGIVLEFGAIVAQGNMQVIENFSHSFAHYSQVV